MQIDMWGATHIMGIALMRFVSHHHHWLANGKNNLDVDNGGVAIAMATCIMVILILLLG